MTLVLRIDLCHSSHVGVNISQKYDAEKINEIIEARVSPAT